MLKKKIIETIKTVAKENDCVLVDLKEETILLESGLDSLGFAVLVARLEDELGYDPFILNETAVYPKTLIQFIELYEKYLPTN